MSELIEKLRAIQGRVSSMGWGDDVRRIEEVVAMIEPKTYNIGPLTMRHVFEANGIENVADMQRAWDAVEGALTSQANMIASARDALSPFAALGLVWSKVESNDDSVWTQIEDSVSYTVGASLIGWNQVTAGELRRAFSTWKELGGE